MNISQKGIDLIKEFEGFSASPYLDSVKIPTIGFGTTKYPNGTSVKLSDAKCTKEQAEQWLQNALESFVSDLNRLVKGRVAQNQFDALCSLVYNIGPSAFSNSTMLKCINAGKLELVPNEFLKWNRAGGQYSQGLMNRRIKEKNLWQTLQE